MKSKEEIEQLADKFATSIYGFRNENHNSYLECKRNCIEFYTQCQEDMAKLTFVPGLDKETLDELFDLHDDDDFIHEDSDKKYTEEDMRELYAYAKTPDVVFYKKNGSKELHSTNLENYLKTINKQD